MGNNRLCKYRPNVIGRFYINDVRGSSAALVDNVGDLKAGFAYDPFGSVWQETGGGKFKYTGKELDSGNDMKLYYYGARYYNAELGRFISPDPIRGYYNLYSYCINNPINFVDPNGEILDVVWPAIVEFSCSPLGQFIIQYGYDIAVFGYDVATEDIPETADEINAEFWDTAEDIWRDFEYDVLGEYYPY